MLWWYHRDGQTHEDRIELIYDLATMPEHPESVPINALLAVKGTPKGKSTQSALARYGPNDCYHPHHLPTSMVRLSAGRVNDEYGRTSPLFYGRS